VLRIDDIDDIDIARQVAQLLNKENSRLHTRIEALVRENAQLRGESDDKQLELEILRLKEQLGAARQREFGASSERQARAPEEAKAKQKPTPPDGVREQASLPVHEEEHALNEAERACCKCGQLMSESADKAECFEEVDIIERMFVLKKHRRRVYECECGATKSAESPLRLPGGGRHSLDFAVHVAFEKWCAHSPLERQVRIMLGEGLDISSTTLWEQAERLARVLGPTYLAMGKYVLESCTVHADETPWYMLNKGRSKWWVWSISRKNAVFYRVDPSRGHKVILEMLEGFSGRLLVDGYEAYNTAAKALQAKGQSVKLGLCWSHARRGFVEAHANYPECSEAIALIGDLFLIERELPDWQVIDDHALREAQLLHIHKIRSEKSAPIIQKLLAWANEQRALPESSLAKALQYLKNQWDDLMVFLHDPRVPLSNNQAERSLRGVVVGRKNHYGSKSQRGTEVAAVFYTLLESAAMAGVDPKAYLRAAAVTALCGQAPLLPVHFKRTLSS
jgi:transposase